MPPRYIAGSGLTVTKALIIINVVVFFVGFYTQQPTVLSLPLEGNPHVYPGQVQEAPASIFQVYGAFSFYSGLELGQIWRLISYQFLHASVPHILFNMWALFFFGPAVETAFGAKRFLAYYLVCGAAGALFYSACAATGILGNEQNLAFMMDGELAFAPIWQFIPLVGASASVYAVLIATAFMFPSARVQLLFPPVVLTLRTMALIVTAIAVLTLSFGGDNQGGEAGHLGGILMGALIMLVLKQRTQNFTRWS